MEEELNFEDESESDEDDEDESGQSEEDFLETSLNPIVKMTKNHETKLDLTLQQRVIENVIEGVESGTKSGTKSGVKSKDNEVYNSMERMMEIKSREKLGIVKTNQSLVDMIDIEDEDMEGSELIDDFVDNNGRYEDPFVGEYPTASATGTKHERNNTDISSNDDSSYEPSHMLLQNRLK